MKTKPITLIALLFLVGTAAAGGAEKSGIEFPHGVHAEMDLDCDHCHAAALTSATGTDHLLPEKPVCADCHDVEDMDNCGYCHTDTDDPWGYVDAEPAVDRFSHVAHVEAGMDCAACHGQPDAIVAAPPKSDCRTCHVTAADLQDCSVCHSEGAEYVPETHAVGWELWHGVEAGHDQQDCSNCHAQVDCQDCHAGDNVAPRVHPLNYAFDHALDARGNQMECTTCHFDPSYCADCHRVNDVLPRNHSRADWVLPEGTDGGSHGTEALLEMEACISCHDTGSSDPICAQCHGR